MYCRFCGKEVIEKAIVCTGCGRPIDTPGSTREAEGADWSIGLLLAMLFASVFFPPIGLIVGVKASFNPATKVKASILLTVASIMALLWIALVLGL